MAYVPSREELYEMVTARFRQAHPDAPERLSSTSSAHAAWRAEWIRIRDEVVADEVNRIYWDQNPGAPHKIEPGNPAHERFKQAWLEIRDRIMSNQPSQPSPADAGDGGVDMSYIRAAVHETLAARLPLIRPDLHEDIKAYAEHAINRIREAGDAQQIPGGGQIWAVPAAIYASREDPDHSVNASADAHWADNGALAGDIYLVVTNPVGQ